jgi:hypothetical protein
VDEYLCVTLVGEPRESEAAFKARLTAFWSHYLRTRPDDYEAVYAEATEFEAEGDAPARRYMVAAGGVEPLTAATEEAGVRYLPVDADDVYTKYEASGREWFQIEH